MTPDTEKEWFALLTDMVKAVKELQAEVTALTKKVTALEQQRGKNGKRK